MLVPFLPIFVADSKIIFDFNFVAPLFVSQLLFEEILENEDYYDRYRENNNERYRKADEERKQYSRLEKKLLNLEKYELKKKEEREHLRLFREKKKLGLVKSRAEQEKKQSAASTSLRTSSTPLKSRQSSKSFSNKQALNRSIKRVQKALPLSSVKKTEVLHCFSKSLSTANTIHRKP